jgi:hypothetical protein
MLHFVQRVGGLLDGDAKKPTLNNRYAQLTLIQR